MKTVNTFIIMALAIVVSSCNFNLSMGHVGNGKVVSQDRGISEEFSGIDASAGLKIFLTEGKENKVVVETDENLQQYIETNIEDGVLKIETSENIKRAKARKIHVTYKALDKIEASSGSSVQAASVIKGQDLSLKATSGAEIEVEVFSQNLSLKSSSGADLEVSGKASSVTIQASSGSEIDAKELEVINCTAKASSGAEISIHVKENIDAKASSGASINYYGNPSKANIDKSSSGSVKKLR